MRFLLLAALLTVAPVAIGQTTNAPQAPAANADTYAAILAHGVVIVTPDAEIDVMFKADGTFTVFGGAASGVWKITGDQLCTKVQDTPAETCAAYPAGKKSGDSFEVTSNEGTATIRIL